MDSPFFLILRINEENYFIILLWIYFLLNNKQLPIRLVQLFEKTSLPLLSTVVCE
jgi:hypothetical protein